MEGYGELNGAEARCEMTARGRDRLHEELPYLGGEGGELLGGESLEVLGRINPFEYPAHIIKSRLTPVIPFPPRGLLLPRNNVPGKSPQGLGPVVKSRDGVEGPGYKLPGPPPRLLEPEDGWVRGLAQLNVAPGGLSHLGARALHVKDVVEYLEGEAHRPAVARKGFKLFFVGPPEYGPAPYGGEY